ncbi:MAG: hypothetical protein NC311_07565 [Muribaculaceae bacterium]|nr:hypothetical protein [Muribaculaceae bacterium]
METIYLGIDPGANGGIAVLDCNGRLIECVKMPSTPMDILQYLKGWDAEPICFMEAVGYGMPGQSSKATATFSRHCGHLEMALLAANIPTTMITPAKWQKHFNLQGKKGEAKTAHKNRIKAWAQCRYPNHKVTLWGADALAIATYAFEKSNK